jgi:phosphoglycerate dehydrogenase-like enzyme
MPKCRVAVTDDLMHADGTMTFPDYSLDLLQRDPRVEIRRISGSPSIQSADLADVDVLISVPMTAPLTAATFPRGAGPVAVVRVGVGYEDVDVNACTRNHLALIIPTDAVRRPTAIAALTLILALATRLVEKHQLTRAGPLAWPGRANMRGTGLAGKVLGLVGCGSIGSDLVALCRPLEMRIVVTDPGLSSAQAIELGVQLVELSHLLSEADFVSIHCPLNGSTRGTIGAAELRAMKPSSFLVNTARGGIVDQPALVEALRRRDIAGAGLDVFAEEPPAPSDPLLSLDNVVLSAHALNWTRELDVELSRSNVRSIQTLAAGSIPEGVVNKAVINDPIFLARLRSISA